MNGLSQMRELISSFTRLKEEEWQQFSKVLLQKSFPKGSYLCKEGQVEHYIFFLVSGATRNYFLKDGKEFTVDFQFEGDLVTAYYSFITRRPSMIAIQAVADIEAILIPYQLLQDFYQQSHSGERIGRLIAEFQYKKRLEREMDLLSITAEDRYRQLMDRNPELVRNTSVKHLSTYLGIQPESLSRIRKLYSGN
ncbi:Crp/Fnr family transcriptional regulator [Pedobacter sp. KBW06]|uniref:Crp/Fnr family transcriptional regulator n=1 Tax=Pedobacter sp. KBW06 TaxID=2153359 RepID=UPI000F59C1E2|nr:Crp/Fnr family transcriptional regulator [Pedobacter sp. KBW06]RQO66224.1 Crp/Fnr family transcriptional regulator [Pedobacter sp. KBW06]